MATAPRRGHDDTDGTVTDFHPSGNPINERRSEARAAAPQTNVVARRRLVDALSSIGDLRSPIARQQFAGLLPGYIRDRTPISGKPGLDVATLVDVCIEFGEDGRSALRYALQSTLPIQDPAVAAAIELIDHHWPEGTLAPPPRNPPQRHASRTNIAILIGMPALALAIIVTYALLRPDRSPNTTGAGNPTTQESGPGLTVSIAYDDNNADSGDPGCGNMWTFRKPPDEIPVPDPSEMDYTWAHAAGGIDLNETYMKLSIQGRSSDAVNIQSMRVIEVSRTPMDAETAVLDEPCGGSTNVRNFTIILNDSPPRISYNNGMSFAFTVSNTEIEQFDIKATFDPRAACDCIVNWKLAVEWSSMGQHHSTTIDNDGAPFQTATTANSLPTYTVNNGKWVKW
ncbi:hypothetical protein FMUAM8_22100 [Nocardia cyriacigeorgica]|nr:hypothetical protein FMUAM8_22100 [Nocardia cyriacigeorgica]